jgi:hypothetical protein
LLFAVLIHELYKGRCLLIVKPPKQLLATNNVELQILIVVTMRSTVFWDVISFSPMYVNRRFGGTHIHLDISFLFVFTYHMDPEDGSSIFL